MALGIYMASIESFKYTPVHAHLTLFGFVSMAIYGLAYRAGLAKNDRWAVAHFWVSAAGAIIFAIGEAYALSGTTIVIAAMGSMSGVPVVPPVRRGRRPEVSTVRSGVERLATTAFIRSSRSAESIGQPTAAEESMNARLAKDRPNVPPLPASSSFAVWTGVRGCDGGARCGDYTAYGLRSNGQLAFVVVDVAGRGAGCRLPAYFLATNLLGMLVLGTPLDRAAKAADRDFRAEFPGHVPEFASVFAGLVDPLTGTMRYVAAGHETAIVLRGRGGGEALAATGPLWACSPMRNTLPQR